MKELYRYSRAGFPDGPLVHRGSVVACRFGREVAIVDAQGVRRVVAEWHIDHCELSPDGRYLLARGDQGKRCAIWETGTCTRAVELVGDPARRESVRASLVMVADETFAFVATTARPNIISQYSLASAVEVAWLSTQGLMAFQTDRVISLTGAWIGAHGHLDGEHYDTVVAVDLSSKDPESLQTALRERPSIKEWGYKLAIGPAGDRGVVVFRDAEWEDGDEPDPDEAFRGIELWDLATTGIIQRISHEGPLAVGGSIGANATIVALEAPDHVALVSRATQESTPIDGAVLDPYALTVARPGDSEDDIVILALEG